MTAWGWIAVVAGVLVQALFATGVSTSQDRSLDGGNVFLGYLVLCAALWALVLWVARLKNRSPNRWLVCTFLFGAIPLVMLLFVPRAKTKEGETRLCPHCQSEIPIAATVCRFCHRDVVDAAPVPVVPAS